MKFTIAVWFIFAAFFISTKDIDAKIDDETVRDMNISLPLEGLISCTCSGLDVEMRMPLEKLGEFYMAIWNDKGLSHCSHCSPGVILCTSLDNSTTSCIKEDLIYDEYFGTTDKDEDASSDRLRRDVDRYGVCNFPRNFKTSHLSCIQYPRAVKCTQRCNFGYTLDEGITREMRCEHEDNVWKPQGFQECSPFVDCTMTLVATGNKSCQLGTPYTPSLCNVTCGDYEDKYATPLTTYECQVTGGWNQKLPHCVISGSGFALVPAPRVKLHNMPEEKEPKKNKPQHTKHSNRKKHPKLEN